MDPSKKQEILDRLHVGPQTAAELAAALYPEGRRYLEDWDLAPVAKVELELGRMGFSVEVVGGRADDPDEPDQLADLWAATTPERAAEIRAAARRQTADDLVDLRRRQRAGTWSVWDKIQLASHLELLRLRRERRRFARLSAAEQVSAFNAEIDRCLAQAREAGI